MWLISPEQLPYQCLLNACVAKQNIYFDCMFSLDELTKICSIQLIIPTRILSACASFMHHCSCSYMYNCFDLISPFMPPSKYLLSSFGSPSMLKLVDISGLQMHSGMRENILNAAMSFSILFIYFFVLSVITSNLSNSFHFRSFEESFFL